MSPEARTRSSNHAGGGLGIGWRGGGAWRPEAACSRSRYSVNLFYPSEGFAGERLTATAKAVCAACPVRRPCLDFALATRQPYGIWGGMTPEERRDLRQT
jgi:WhiB family redox-sensing transcriptional regulator